MDRSRVLVLPEKLGLQEACKRARQRSWIFGNEQSPNFQKCYVPFWLFAFEVVVNSRKSTLNTCVEALNAYAYVVSLSLSSFVSRSESHCLEPAVSRSQAREIARRHTQKFIMGRKLMSLRELSIQQVGTATLYYHPFLVISYRGQKKLRVLDLASGSWEGLPLSRTLGKLFC